MVREALSMQVLFYSDTEVKRSCLPPSIPRDQLIWLHDPVLEENGEHFKSNSEIKGEETTKQDRPSLKKTKPVAAKRALEQEIQQHDPPVENAPVANTSHIKVILEKSYNFKIKKCWKVNLLGLQMKHVILKLCNILTSDTKFYPHHFNIIRVICC